MLSVKQLARLRESVGDEYTLSVYLSAPETDPALQSAWRLRVLNAVRAERERLVEANEPIDGFEAAWQRVEATLPSSEGALGSPGRVVFANAERVLHSCDLPTSVGSIVSWRSGLRLAPYARALSRTQDLLLVLADGRRARVFNVADGSAQEVEDFIADRAPSEGAGPGMGKRPSARSGVRGETRQDAAERAATVSVERMVQKLAEVVAARAVDVPAVLLGGNERVVHALTSALPGPVAERTTIRGDLHVTMTDAEIADVAAEVATDAAAVFEAALLDEWSEEDPARGLAARGWNPTVRGIEEGAVELLLLSGRFLSEQAEDAEALIGQVFEQGGSVHALEGAAGERLDEVARGIGARLRFVPSLGGGA